MPRKKAHREEKEPFLEDILGVLRYKKIIGHISQNAKILDLGCGHNANFIKIIHDKKGCECTGLDISINRGINLGNTVLIEHDLNNEFPFPDNSFDFVTSLASLEHLHNQEAVLKEVYRVLRPGGMFLLTVPSIYAKPVLEFLAFQLHVISENEIKDHKRYFCKQSILELCKKTGFPSAKHKYFQFFMNNFVVALKNV